MDVYSHFITENIAPANARNIGVYRNGEMVGRIPLGSLTPPYRRKRLYSFGVIADTEMGVAGRKTMLQNTIERMEKLGVKFICIAGDLVEDRTIETQWQDHKEAVANASVPVYAINGNHEQWKHEGVPERSKEYAGIEAPLYHFTEGNDLFVMVGAYSYYQADLQGTNATQQLSAQDLRDLRSLMNENRNRRCFLIMHVPPQPSLPEYNINTAENGGYLPMSFFQHFKNASVFHAHTHVSFGAQETNKKANYRSDKCFRSVHIPALSDNHQGYIVDVYKDGYHLRGMDLAENKDIPLANYWIDTVLVEVEDEY